MKIKQNLRQGLLYIADKPLLRRWIVAIFTGLFFGPYLVTAFRQNNYGWAIACIGFMAFNYLLWTVILWGISDSYRRQHDNTNDKE